MNKQLFYINPASLEELQNNIKEVKQGVDLSYFINTRKESYMTDSGVAVIDVRGALLDDCPEIYTDLGNTDYRQVAKDLDDAVDAGARGIVFSISSGGGSVAGCFELADKISNLNVPCVAYGDGLMCSAAYKLGCSTDYIIARPSAECGNIGTILTYADPSRMYEAMGVDHKAITNDEATLKSTFHVMPLTNEQEQFLQDQINEAGEAFISHVKSHRPNVDEECFKAGWYKGEAAIEKGLIDQIGTLEDAVEMLTQIADALV